MAKCRADKSNNNISIIMGRPKMRKSSDISDVSDLIEQILYG